MNKRKIPTTKTDKARKRQNPRLRGSGQNTDKQKFEKNFVQRLCPRPPGWSSTKLADKAHGQGCGQGSQHSFRIMSKQRRTRSRGSSRSKLEAGKAMEAEGSGQGPKQLPDKALRTRLRTRLRTSSGQAQGVADSHKFFFFFCSI